MVTFLQYSFLSTSVFLSVILHAFYSRGQFYSAMVYLSTSKFSLLAISNMFVFLLIFTLAILQTIFLGTLREVEIERLHELSLHELMETALAMTIFRDEFDTYFAAMFAILMAIKILHWLCQKRVEYIETTPSISRISHLRIFTFMCLLIIVDSFFFHHAVLYTIKHKVPSVRLLFAFEFFILASSTLVTMIKYALYTADMVMDGQWDNKAVYVFYLEFFRDILHLSAYTTFFLIIFRFYGLPLHLMRDLYETFRNFRTRIADFIRYRKITSNLNERFTDATSDEISRGDSTCIICREEMATAKKLPCGHMFHIHCLRSWLERQQTCPTCRASLLETAQEDAAANQQQDAGVGVGNINFVVQRFFRLNQNQNMNQNQNINQNLNQNQAQQQQQQQQYPQQINANYLQHYQNWAQYYFRAYGNSSQQNLNQMYQNVANQSQSISQYYQQLARYYQNQTSALQQMARDNDIRPYFVRIQNHIRQRNTSSRTRQQTQVANMDSNFPQSTNMAPNPQSGQSQSQSQSQSSMADESIRCPINLPNLIPATLSSSSSSSSASTPSTQLPGSFPSFNSTASAPATGPLPGNTTPSDINPQTANSASNLFSNSTTANVFSSSSSSLPSDVNVNADMDRMRRMYEYYTTQMYGQNNGHNVHQPYYGYHPFNNAYYMYSPAYMHAAYANSGYNSNQSSPTPNNQQGESSRPNDNS